MLISLKRLTIITVSLALFMDVLDSNVINTAIPAMSRSLLVHPVDLKIALISYLLSLAIFIPTSGWTADKYGAKRIFIVAIGLFALSSFWCGYAHTLLELVIARCFQGIGGAFMISLGRLMVVRTFERHELVEAMNTVIIVVSVAVMLGPFVGGVITDHFSWPWIFWINIPAALFTMLFAAGLKDTSPKHVRPFDFLGFILFGGGLALLSFALSELSESTVKPLFAGLLLVIAALMLVIYMFHAKRQIHPLININLLHIRTFRISLLGNLTARIGFGGIPFLLPLLLQIGLGYSAQLSGLLMVPIAFGIIFSKLLVLRILRKVGYKRYLIVNTLIVAVVLLLFQMINQTSSVYFIASMTFIFGIAISAQFTGMNSLAFADIHQDELSAVTSITSTIQVLSQSFGVAVGAMLLRFLSFLANQPLLLTAAIFHKTFIILAILTMLSSFVFIIGLRTGDGKQMLDAKPK